jgi:cell shape-determining protein MreC
LNPRIKKIPNTNENNSEAKQITDDLKIIKDRLEEYCDMVERFDKSFWFHQRSQLFRYWIVELGLPILLSILSLGILINHLYTC